MEMTGDVESVHPREGEGVESRYNGLVGGLYRKCQENTPSLPKDLEVSPFFIFVGREGGDYFLPIVSNGDNSYALSVAGFAYEVHHYGNERSNIPQEIFLLSLPGQDGKRQPLDTLSPFLNPESWQSLEKTFLLEPKKGYIGVTGVYNEPISKPAVNFLETNLENQFRS